MAKPDLNTEYRIKTGGKPFYLELDQNKKDVLAVVELKNTNHQKWKIFNDNNEFKIKSVVEGSVLSFVERQHTILPIAVKNDGDRRCTLTQMGNLNEYRIGNDKHFIAITAISDSQLVILEDDNISILQRWVLDPLPEDPGPSPTGDSITIVASGGGKRQFTRRPTGSIYCYGWKQDGKVHGSAEGSVLVRADIPRANTPMAAVAWGGSGFREIRFYFVNKHNILQDMVSSGSGSWTHGKLVEKKLTVDQGSTLTATHSPISTHITVSFTSDKDTKNVQIPK